MAPRPSHWADAQEFDALDRYLDHVWDREIGARHAASATAHNLVLGGLTGLSLILLTATFRYSTLIAAHFAVTAMWALGALLDNYRARLSTTVCAATTRIDHRLNRLFNSN